MTKNNGKTVGQIALQAAKDKTVYDPLEIAQAQCDDVSYHLWMCIEAHRSIIDEPEFCVVMILADDPLIKGVLRRKFYAWPYLPSPRPRQAVFLYTKANDNLRRLWVLPPADTMAVLSDAITVPKGYETMRAWSNAFYRGKFWEFIRATEGINLLSEKEYLNANREKLIQAGCKEVSSFVPEPFDFSKVATYKIIDSKEPSLKQ